MHDAHLHFNDFKDCFKKWCEKEKYFYEIYRHLLNNSNYVLDTPNGRYPVSEYFEESEWPEYGFYFDHCIVMGTPNRPESYYVFFSLLKFAVTNTDSDIFSFLEGGRPLLYRKGDVILTEYTDEIRQDYFDGKLPFDELFSGLDIKVVDDIDKYLGLK